jgi:hypothetical protein
VLPVPLLFKSAKAPTAVFWPLRLFKSASSPRAVLLSVKQPSWQTAPACGACETEKPAILSAIYWTTCNAMTG